MIPSPTPLFSTLTKLIPPAASMAFNRSVNITYISAELNEFDRYSATCLKDGNSNIEITEKSLPLPVAGSIPIINCLFGLNLSQN